jgi:sugar lactone lactonase YvrE
MPGETPRLLADGLGFPESTRWRDGKAWLCNWGAGEVLTVDLDGAREVMARIAPGSIPFSIDWLPDGRLLVVDGPRQLLLAQAADGDLEPYADLSEVGEGPFNEVVVGGRGQAYVNGGPGLVVCVDPDGSAHQVADGLRWPNGMALIDGDRVLVVADSHAEALIAFELGDDGRLAERRIWAGLPHPPDGICADAEGAIWVATVPGQCCLRVREGGEILETVSVDRACFACMLGGHDGRTLLIAAAQWRGMEAAMRDGPGLTGQLLAAADRAVPHAGRP